VSVPAYADYKDSGVKWLDPVPSHWTVTALKRRLDIVGGSTPKSDVAEYWDGDIPWITPADLSRLTDFYIRDALRYITADGLASCGTTMVPAGSVILSTRAPIGSLGIATVDVCTNQGCKALVPTDIDRVFLAYLLSVCSTELNVRGRGSTFLELSGDELGAFRITSPPRDEQAAIAFFLDRDTAKIGALVAEQERLIALLNEKRQAVISHAVTKGLNPIAPMKDSGIEWLGEIPAHWDVRRLRQLATLNPSKSEIGDWDAETEVSFLPMEAIGEHGTLSLERTRPIAETQTGYTYFREGDVTIAKITPCFENGKGAIMKGLVQGVGFGTTELIVIRPSQDATTSEFLDWNFRSETFRALGEGSMYGAGGQKRVPDDFVRDFPICLPSLEEQRQIVGYLDRVTLRFDILSAEAQSAIALLQERRAALISAAVTGKIDVRGLVPQTPELEPA
jgi:type I restriction enzyme S subunit